jgi:hypothetical protein
VLIDDTTKAEVAQELASKTLLNSWMPTWSTEKVHTLLAGMDSHAHDHVDFCTSSHHTTHQPSHCAEVLGVTSSL